MELDLNPVNVTVDVQSTIVDKYAFYNVCFITEKEGVPRTLEVRKLQDLLDNGYDRIDLAYNFCYTVLSQGQMESITVRSKSLAETYQDAYLVDDNSDYYYVVIDSKNPDIIFEFNDFLTESKEMKLQFFSHKDDLSAQVKGRKIVYYYNPFIPKSNMTMDEYIGDYYLNSAYQIVIPAFFSDGIDDYFTFDGDEVVAWDNEDRVLLEKQDMSFDQSKLSRIAYPEAGWIAKCGFKFPSLIQWLYKYINLAETVKQTNIPDLSTTSSIVHKVKATIGSGVTGLGLTIQDQVCLDWVVWAIQKRLWDYMYKNDDIPATNEGLDIVENELVSVLEIAKDQKMFERWKITSRGLDRLNNKASLKFEATLTHSIMGVRVAGTVYY